MQSYCTNHFHATLFDLRFWLNASLGFSMPLAPPEGAEPRTSVPNKIHRLVNTGAFTLWRLRQSHLCPLALELQGSSPILHLLLQVKDLLGLLIDLLLRTVQLPLPLLLEFLRPLLQRAGEVLPGLFEFFLLFLDLAVFRLELTCDNEKSELKFVSKSYMHQSNLSMELMQHQCFYKIRLSHRRSGLKIHYSFISFEKYLVNALLVHQL